MACFYSATLARNPTGVDTSSFMNGMKKAAEQSAETSKQIKERFDLAKEAVVGLAEAFAVDWIAEKVNQALEFAEALKKVSEQTGLSTQQIQEFRYAASQAGVATEQADAGLLKFNKTLGDAQLGNQKAGKALKELGVTSTDLHTAILQAADGFEHIKSKSEQAALSFQVFGRQNGALVIAMAEGAKGLNEYAQQAQELGLALNEQTVNGAVNAAHKLSALSMVLKTELSSAVAQNASGIANFADMFIRLASEIGIAGRALANFGARRKINLAENTLSGWFSTDAQKDQARLDINNARNSMLQETDDSAKIYDFKTRKLIGEKHEGEGENGVLPPLKSTTRKPRDRTEIIAAEFDKSLSSAQQSNYSLQEQLTGDPGFKAMYQHDASDAKFAGKTKEISDELAAGKYGAADSAIAKERAAQLQKLADLNHIYDAELINRKEDDALDQQALALQTNDIQTRKALLQSQEGLATTQADRRAIGQQLLDLDYQEKKLALDAQLISEKRNHASQEQLDLTEAQIAALAGQKAADEKSLDNSTMGPLAAYLKSIPTTASEIDESLQTASVSGLTKLNDGILAAIKGTGNLKTAFKDLTGSIIDGILKIGIQEAIIKPLAAGLFGSDGSGGLLGGLFTSIGASILHTGTTTTGTSGLTGYRANGGMTASGTYLVGERGPELVQIGNSANVVPTSAMQGLSGGGGGGINVSFGPITSNDPEAVKAMAYQAIMEAAPMLTKRAVDATYVKLRRPTM